MPRDKISMPSSSAGVLSFYDEERSTIKLKPTHVVILAVLIGAAVIYLQVI
ncbi:MAG: preprotein translocase subunit Sec61beta [Candidatus Woesearchaeota archaeon]|nr:preprotein translocase subunit Sec61beta [Candidatus Woesearchaeota archaeon]